MSSCCPDVQVQVPGHVHLYFCPSDELSLFQLFVIGRSYVVLLYHCPREGEGWDPANMFNPATIMYVCAFPKSGACNSVVVVCLCVTDLLFVHFVI